MRLSIHATGNGGIQATGNRGSMGLGWHRVKGDSKMVNGIEYECGIVKQPSTRLGKKDQDALDMT